MGCVPEVDMWDVDITVVGKTYGDPMRVCRGSPISGDLEWYSGYMHCQMRVRAPEPTQCWVVRPGWLQGVNRALWCPRRCRLATGPHTLRYSTAPPMKVGQPRWAVGAMAAHSVIQDTVMICPA